MTQKDPNAQDCMAKTVDYDCVAASAKDGRFEFQMSPWAQKFTEGIDRFPSCAWHMHAWLALFDKIGRIDHALVYNISFARGHSNFDFLDAHADPLQAETCVVCGHRHQIRSMGLAIRDTAKTEDTAPVYYVCAQCQAQDFTEVSDVWNALDLAFNAGEAMIIHYIPPQP